MHTLPMTPLKVGLAFSSIFLTSADDALWLLPFLISPRLSRFHRCVHALIFIGAMQGIVLMSFLLSLTGKHIARHTYGLISLDPSAELSILAALAAWLFFLFLLLRKWWKNRHRSASRTRGYSVINEDEDLELGAILSPSSDAVDFSPKGVLFLALVGALDELCYFPALLISGDFTPLDLSLAALLACSLVLLIITVFLSRCRRMLEWMDKVPMSAVVGVYAVSLTVQAVRDCLRE